MNKRAPIDLELLVPILIGGFSVVGIVVVLFLGRLLNSPAEIAPTPSSTPFQYVYLGTEPAITTLVVDGSELPPSEEPGEVAPTMVEFTRRPAATPIILGTATSTAGVQRTNTSPPTSTSASGPPLGAGTFDDIDYRLVYKGAWESRPLTGAYGNTLHVSLVPSSTSTISFRFIGRELRLFYQGGSTLGRLTIMIDNETETLDQSDGTEWVSETYSNGTHTVLITHIGGGSVNLDYVIIPEVPATATRTPTP